MKQTYTNEQVRQCCLAYANGQSVAELANKLNIPQSTIYTWIKREQQHRQEEKEKLPLKSAIRTKSETPRMYH